MAECSSLIVSKYVRYGYAAGQAKDLNKLTVPGRRSSTTLKRDGEDASDSSSLSLDVPVNVFSKDSIKKLTTKKGENEGKSEKKPPAVVRTEIEIKKTETPGAPKTVKDEVKVQKKEPPPIDRSLKTDQKPVPQPTIPSLQMEGGILKPSQVKSTGFMPTNKQEKRQEKPLPAPVKSTLISSGFSIAQTPPPVAPVPQRRTQEPERRQAPGRVQQVKQSEQMPQQTFKGTAELENVDFVRRPTRPHHDNAQRAPPAITVIPSTPKPTDVPIPSSPTHDVIVQKASVHKPAASQLKEKPKTYESSLKQEEAKEKAVEQKSTGSMEKPVETKETSVKPKPTAPIDNPAEPKEVSAKPKKSAEPKYKEKPKDKLAAPKAPADKPQEQKPSTPPAATFQSNASNKADEPLIGEEQKKGGWL